MVQKFNYYTINPLLANKETGTHRKKYLALSNNEYRAKRKPKY